MKEKRTIPMLKDTKKDIILSLMALSGGGMRKHIAEETFGKYGRSVLTQLEKDGLIKTKKSKPIFIYLTQKGLEYLDKNDIILSNLLIKNTSNTGFTKINISGPNDGIKYSSKSDVMITLKEAGVEILPSKRGIFGEEETDVAGFSIKEVKHAIDPKYQLASGSVCHGVLVCEDSINMMYHFENGQINVNQTVEQNLKEAVEAETDYTKKINLIALDFGYHGLTTIFRNSVIEEKDRKRAKGMKTKYVSNLIGKDINYEEKYYVPSGKEGAPYIDAITNIDLAKRLVEFAAASKKVEEGGIAGLGFAEGEREIISLFPMTFSAIYRLMSKRNKSKPFLVIALKSAVDELDKLLEDNDIEWLLLEDKVVRKNLQSKN